MNQIKLIALAGGIDNEKTLEVSKRIFTTYYSKALQAYSKVVKMELNKWADKLKCEGEKPMATFQDACPSGNIMVETADKEPEKKPLSSYRCYVTVRVDVDAEDLDDAGEMVTEKIKAGQVDIMEYDWE